MGSSLVPTRFILFSAEVKRMSAELPLSTKMWNIILSAIHKFTTMASLWGWINGITSSSMKVINCSNMRGTLKWNSIKLMLYR